jgi:translation initiation factor 1 (eIF-1/SUI1)
MSMVDVVVTRGYNITTITGISEKGIDYIDQEMYTKGERIGIIQVQTDVADDLIEDLKDKGLDVQE